MSLHPFSSAPAFSPPAPGEGSRYLWSLIVPEDAAALASSAAGFGQRGRKSLSSRRIPIGLAGRYMIADGSEFPCQTVELTPEGLSIRGLRAGNHGEWVIAYIEGLGRVEGVIARRAPIWFLLDLRAPSRKLEKLAGRLQWLIAREKTGSPDRRAYPRFDQFDEPATLRTADGREVRAELIDVSLGGAAINVAAPTPVGAPVELDGQNARVVRKFPGGLAVEFEPAAVTPLPNFDPPRPAGR